MYLSLYCKGSKRVVWGFTVRGSWKPNRNCNILTPTLVFFSFSRAAQPEAQGPSFLLDDGFLYCILSATSLDPNSIGGPEPLRPGVTFPTTSRLLTRLISNCLSSVLTELYNSSTPSQSPTQSLEWHVWSSSSGNTVMQFTGHSLPVHHSEVGPSPCPILSAELTCTISSHKCHWNVSLPSGASLWIAFLAGSKVKI